MPRPTIRRFAEPGCDSDSWPAAGRLVGGGRVAESVLFIDLLGGLGDLLIALPAVHGLADSHGGVHVLTHSPGASLLDADPAIRSIRTADRGTEVAAVADALAELRPDLVVSTSRHGGIPDLVAATGCRAVTDLWRHPPPDQMVGDRYVQILRDEGVLDAAGSDRVVLTGDELRRAAATVSGLVGSGRPVVLVPAAGMTVKEWPRARWAELAGRLADAGLPVLTCAEQPVHLPGAVALPAGSLREVAGWLAEVGRRGGVVVGGDTGPVRLAAAVGARTVALFGPTVRERYGLATAVNLQGLPDCPHRRPLSIAEQVCWWTADCPLSPTGPACMADITEAAVRTAVLT